MTLSGARRLVPTLAVGVVALAVVACVAEPVEPTGPRWELTTDGSIEPVIGDFSGPDELELAPPGAYEGRDFFDTVDSSPIEAVFGFDRAQNRSPGQSTTPDLLSLLGAPATEADLDPDFLADQPPSPFHRLGHSVIRGLDGSWSKIYTLRSNTSQNVVQLLQAHVPGFPDVPMVAWPVDGPADEIIRYVLHQNFHQDLDEKLGIREKLTQTNVADMLIVTAPPEILLFIDELLHNVLGDLPQIELEVRVVEVNVDDLIDYDAEFQWKDLVDNALPFDAVDNPAAGAFGGGLPILDVGGAETGSGAAFGSLAGSATLPGFLMSLQGVHNNVTVDAVISLLQTIGAGEIISSPTVTVLNGHRARLNTGDRVPTFEAQGVGLNPSIVTEYQDTGVQLDMVPFIVSESEGLIRIDLSIDVSQVTGEVPFLLAGVEVLNPIISQREAGTTIHVYSGQTFALAGLKNSRTIENITKVPLLGDIPILGWLFKSRSSREVHGEILFFITPRIRIPSEGLIVPVGK